MHRSHPWTLSSAPCLFCCCCRSSRSRFGQSKWRTWRQLPAAAQGVADSFHGMPLLETANHNNYWQHDTRSRFWPGIEPRYQCSISQNAMQLSHVGGWAAEKRRRSWDDGLIYVIQTRVRSDTTRSWPATWAQGRLETATCCSISRTSANAWWLASMQLPTHL